MEVDWERFPLDLADQEGQFNDLVSRWMDEYGTNIHEQVWATEPTPALQAAASGVAHQHDDGQASGRRSIWDEMDELYDQRIWEAGWGYPEHEEMHA